MQLTWYPKAVGELSVQMALCRKLHGPLTTLKARDNVKKQVHRLTHSPEIGVREPLLKEKSKDYRSLVILPHFKIVYFIDESADRVCIVDFWNTLRNPVTLASRLS